MSNFTDRLRELRGIANALELEHHAPISARKVRAAAARIEALEAALTEIATAPEHLEIFNSRSEGRYEGAAAQAKIAREALVVRTDASEAPDAE